MKLQTLSAVMLIAFSLDTMADDGAYWTTVNGNIFRSATTGECVRSGSWTPEKALAECEGEKEAATPEPAATAAAVAAAPVDSDADGVTDDLDKCPGSPANKPVDADGCTIESVVLKNVNFELNSSELTAGSSESLDKAVAAMNRYPDLRIEIQAHTDNTGDADYNQYLSEKRAESVRDYMVARGIASDRMEVKGYGETSPVADNNTREGRAANRRVELKVLD
jgi:outer membrane protein OmpA-like peptidoglycan-associated protein